MTISKLLYTLCLSLSVIAVSASTASTAATPKATATADISLNDSCFVHLDSNLYVVSTELPRFYDEFLVGEVSPAGYDVQLLYPEFKDLSAKELRSIKRLQQEGALADDAQIDATSDVLHPMHTPVHGLGLEQSLSMSRKQGYLGVEFCPIVRHEGKWKRILSCQIRISACPAVPGAPTAAAKRAESTERWAQNSVLATGKWVKVRVKNEGIYQLTASDVKAMGFSDLSKVKVYGYGGLIQDQVFRFPEANDNALQTTAPDDLCEVATHQTADGRLLFWAEGTRRLVWDKSDRSYSTLNNHYSNYSYYFVTENDAPRQDVVKVSSDKQAENLLTSVNYIGINDNDAFNWYFGGRIFFDEYDFSSGNSHGYKLFTPDVVNSDASKRFEISFGAASTVTTTLAANINGKPLGTVSIEPYAVKNSVARVSTKTYKVAVDLNPTESNTVQFTPATRNSAHLNYVSVNYERQLNAAATPYSFIPSPTTVNTADYGCVMLSIAGANSSTRLWRIAQQGSPTVEYEGKLEDGNYNVNVDTPARRFVFFDESKTFGAPEVVGEVKNQNLHACSAIDYVIIIPANGVLREQATRLGEIHADPNREGMSYIVVSADELYNEFSSGTPDASAYRRFLKMLYDRAGNDEQAMPKYCLLMGKSPWDNRMVTKEWAGKNPDDYLLAFEANEDAMNIGSDICYLTDDFYGFLDDGEGSNLSKDKLDVSLGRMVCITPADAERLIDKVVRYLDNKNAGIWKNTIVMLADNGDKNKHMNDAEQVTARINDINPSLDVQKVYWDRYKWMSSATGYTFPQGTDLIKKYMTDGALMFNYSGHGSPGMISHYKLLTTPDFKEPLSQTMPLWVLASCEIYPFDTDEANIAETSLFAENGGAIAFMCATRAVYADRNVLMNNQYCTAVLERDATGALVNTMGEALRKAKLKLIDPTTPVKDNTINKLKYVFFGDPALKLGVPTGKIVIDAINDQPLTEMKGLAELQAGSVVTFSGHVCKAGDPTTIDTAFDGNVTASIFDCEETVNCKNNLQEHYNDDPKQPLIDPMVYEERTKTIFKGTTKAQNGEFSFTLVIPRDISYSNRAGRISLYAISTDNKTEYNGYSQSFYLNGTAETEADTEAPKVVLYIDNIDNPDYTITDENPVLIADVSDDYGINNAGISLGHDIELVLDGNSSEVYNLNSYFTYDFGSYQRGQVVYPLKGLSRGPHNAQIRVWDVNNNLATAEVNFIVRTEESVNKEEGYVTATRNPATTSTQFITYFPADTEVSGLVHYEVYDTRGRCVFKDGLGVSPASTSCSYVWDLCGNDHQPLPAGVYFYRTVINTSKGVLATDAQKLIITRQ